MKRSAAEVLLYADCSIVEKLVMQIIADHARATYGSGGCPGLWRIAKMARVSRSTVHYALISLRDKGWLSWISGSVGKKKANTYTLHFDAIPMLDLYPADARPPSISDALQSSNSDARLASIPDARPDARSPDPNLNTLTRRRAQATPPLSTENLKQKLASGDAVSSQKKNPQRTPGRTMEQAARS